MRKITYYFLASTIAFIIGLTAFALWYFTHSKTPIESSALPVIQNNLPNVEKSISGEILLSEMENAYNPIPGPDGSLIAYVRTGWGRPGEIGGLGRSNLISEIAVMNADGNVQTQKSLADAFLYDWSADGKSLNCYRDGNYSTVSIEGKVLMKGRLPLDSFSNILERVTFLPNTNSVMWLQSFFTNIKYKETSPSAYSVTSDFVSATIQSPEGEVAKRNSGLNTDALLISSPNGRYLAVASPYSKASNNSLLIYDRQKASWTNLGKIIIHPDENWDYIKPSWNPWFADSSRLVFATTSGIVISSPDGKSKQIISKPKQANGLAVPSPDGNLVAYATFNPTPLKERPDLEFWGGSIIWIVPVTGNSTARAVTQKTEDETLSLHWLNVHELVFDRIADEEFYRKARLWKVDISK